MSYLETSHKYYTLYIKNLELALQERFQKVFNDNTLLNKFSWTQYTDYYNDGDPTKFSINRECISINDHNYGEELAVDIEDQITGALEDFEDDDLYNLFGDHARIVVYVDGRMDLEEYKSHE